AAAGAYRLRSVPPARTGDRAPRRGPAREAWKQRDHVDAVRGCRRPAAPPSESWARLHAHSRAVLLLVRGGAAAEAIRNEHGALGRAEGVHDDRPPAAAICDQ